MSDRVNRWLEEIGLGEYTATFAENAIDEDVLSDLTEADLEKVGVKLGHRKKLLKAIAELAGEKPPAPVRASREPASQAHEPDESLAAWERQPGERKPVTTLFADITGSTALTEKLDAEETHDLLYGATQRMCEAVENNRGTICRFMGDGVMAMFGAPVASEHHAVDACEAALEMQHAIRVYASDVEARHGSGLQIRVGLHSGEVVVLTVGEGDKVEYDASGPTVPIAARMEQAAQPGEVYLTAATHSLAAHRIDTEALEPVSVKGISEPVPVFLLRRVRSAEEARRDRAATPFVGRRADLIQFRGMLEACIEEGHGQTFYVRGEPGIGKTRLVEEFARIAAEKGTSSHRGLVLPFGVGKGQDAIRSLVRSLLGVPVESGKAERERAADKAINDGRLGPDQAVFLNDLLDLPQPTELRALYDAMNNATRNERKRVVVSTLVTTTSSSRPVLAIVEDVHWADAITLAYLATLTKTVAECPALLVMTSRIEGDQLDQKWRSRTEGSPFITVDLGPLRKQDSIALISEFIDAADPLAASCLERAAGNPLFLEQLLRTAQEGSAASLPDSIQSLVLARMDRLEPDDKKALQAAAVIGQRFHADALSQLLGTSHYDCGELVNHNLIRPEGDGYLFAHALIQEGIYGSLLKRQRYELHRKAAEWYAGDDAALHAEHLAGADDDNAPRAFLDAAREQTQHYRFERALDLTERGLALATEQSDQHGLICLKGELLLDLAEVQSSISAYQEALEKAADDVQRCEAWMGLAAGMRVATDYKEALVLLDRAESAATNHHLTPNLARLHHLRGNLCFSLGRADDCRNEHLLALKFANQSQSAEGEARALGGLGDAEYARGRMRTAHDYYSRCIDLSRKHGFGRIEVAHLGQRGFTRLYSGDWRGAKAEGLAAVEAAAKVGDRRVEMNAIGCLLHTVVDLGEYDLLEAYAEQQLALARTLGARTWEPLALAWMAIVLGAKGRQSEARELLMEAASITREVGRAFNAGRIFGALAWVMASDAAAREAALDEGEAALREGSVSHNYFWFYRFAIDALLNANDWERVERYAAALEEYTRDEPLGWTDFFIARGRALAAFGRGKRDDATVKEVQRLRDEADRVGLASALPSLEDALSTT
ncbi:MAG: adenylate/guanylate cyclase domain-containing protein [Hyphomicrobiaceae bacterium]